MPFRPERLLENHSVTHAQCFAMEEPSGRTAAVVVARLAWRVSPQGVAEVALPQRPIRMTPSYYREVGGSVVFPSDRATAKQGTDVLLIGSAHPRPAPATAVDVGLRVASPRRTLEKAVRVFGRRVFMQTIRGVVPGPSAVIHEPVPLVYEFAEGGALPGATSHRGPAYDNPAGLGHTSAAAELIGSEAYRIEGLGGRAPAGFAAIPPQWPRRRALFGTTDDRYFRTRYPVAPSDYSARFTSDAHPDLWSEEPLLGDEPVEIVGAVPEGVWRYRLPLYAPRFDVTEDGESRPLSTHLDTYLIDLRDPDERIVELTWRVAVPLPKKDERLSSIRVTDRTEWPAGFHRELKERADRLRAERQATA